MNPTTYSCQIVRTPQLERDRDRGEAHRAPDVAGDEDRAAPEAVDPGARRQAEQDERQELDRPEQRDLERGRIQQDDRHERDREQADLRPELADRLGRPELRTKSGWRRRLAGLGLTAGESTRVAAHVSASAARAARRSIDGVLDRVRPERLRGPAARRGRPAGRRRSRRSPGVHLLDRTSDASHNRSVFTHGRRARPGRARPSSGSSRPRSTRSTWTPTAASTRASAPSTSSRSCPLGDDDDGRLRRARPRRSASAIATRFDLPVYLYANAATPRRPGEAGRRPARPVRGPARPRSTQRGREPDFGPARLHPSAGAVAVGARPFLIAYNINLDSDGRRARQADRPARPRVGRRPAEGPGQRLLDRGAAAAPRSR